MIEEWKDVVGWEEKYKVSNLARVWNKITDVEVAQVLTGIPQYKYVNLNYEGQHKLRRIHVLVAQAFIENDDPENKKFVDHIDRNKMNNHQDNLRWVTQSENKRNLDPSIYFGDMHIRDFLLKYEKPEAAYQHIYTSLRNGLSQEEAILRYDEFLQYGLFRRKVVWNDDEVYLTDLCNEYSRDYSLVSGRLSQGWDLWNAVLNIPVSHPHSFEISDSKGVGHWYKNNEMFETKHPTCFGVYKELMKEGRNLCEILSYDGKEHLRQTVLGVTGTIRELCKHFEVSEGAVLTNMNRKGMTPEEALTSPRQRVKRLSINGVYNSPKYWYESFGINAKTANKRKSEFRLSFKQTFEHFGVDTSDMVITVF